MSAAPALFSPGRIGGLALKNRILMAPMEKNLALPTGAVTQRYIDYCEARAAGGAALLLLESMYVHPAGQNHRHQLGLHDDDLVPAYRRLIAACHRRGALVGAQLQFGGRETSSAITGTQPVAPSPVPWFQSGYIPPPEPPPTRSGRSLSFSYQPPSRGRPLCVRAGRPLRRPGVIHSSPALASGAARPATAPPHHCQTGWLHVGVGGVLLDHPVGVEERGVQRDRVPHDLGKAGAILVVERDDDVGQLVVE